MNIGDVFLMPNPREGPGMRLWIVIAKINGQLAVVVCRPLRTLRDEVCIVTPEEHAAILEDSAISYRHQELNEIQLEAAREAGRLAMKDPCTPELLDRIQRGALDSDFTEPRLEVEIRRALGL